jgi:hypothetical protein
MLRWRIVSLLVGGVLPATVWLAFVANADPPSSGAPSLQPQPPTPQSQAQDSWSVPTRPDSVAAGVSWLARHQSPDGSWDFAIYRECCKDDTCFGVGEPNARTTATAAALLCFLGRGDTHKTSYALFKEPVQKAIDYLIRSQRDDGSFVERIDSDPAGNSLATIAVCEAFGMTADKVVQGPAQRAIRFIEKSPASRGDRWNYRPGVAGDSSVVVWQMLALRSGEINGLTIDRHRLETLARSLRDQAIAADDDDVAAAAAGLLATQVLGIGGDAAEAVAFVSRLHMCLPGEEKKPDCVARFWATLALHYAGGATWEKWRGKLRAAASGHQATGGCADGSLSPNDPAADAWGRASGRLFVTAMSVVSIEVYYRHLPSFVPLADRNKFPPNEAPGR